MMQFTNVTGLTGCAIACVAMAFLLPGVRRMQITALAGIACAVFVAVLAVPLEGLPLAAYLRGVTGDFSITTLVLLLMFILHPFLGSRAQMRGAYFRHTGCGGRCSLLALVALFAVFLYPMALGWTPFDPYRLGYGNLWFVGGLFVVALARARELPLMALTVALAVLAWGIGWYESNNLWDYLIDPWGAAYAVGASVRHGARRLWKLRRT
jgi:hypothetical protein